MQLNPQLTSQAANPAAIHLSYCSNIHAGENLDEILLSLQTHLPQIRAHLQAGGQLAAGQMFGLGLRLSAQAAHDLQDPEQLQRLREVLKQADTYVFTVNAFPWGNFQRHALKQDVYQPDWRDARRVAYTCEAAQVLAQLLPPGVSGSISTVPLGFLQDENGPLRVCAAPATLLTRVLENLRTTVAFLQQLHHRSGHEIVLGLEPEPACLLDNSADARAFFSDWWFASDNLQALASLCACSVAEAGQIARRYLGLCFDACHSAVAFEDPRLTLESLQRDGIRLSKIQLSCALRVAAINAQACSQLRAFDDGVYLHQVVRQQANPAGTLLRHMDLPQALQHTAQEIAGEEWRIHCHVPLFWRGMEDDDNLGSTWDSLRAVLRLVREQALSPHLEVETYTWDVLPAALRQLPKAEAIARELQTVIQEWQS